MTDTIASLVGLTVGMLFLAGAWAFIEWMDKR